LKKLVGRISTKDGYLWYLTIKTGVAFSNSYVDFFAGVNNGDLHGISSWDLISGWWGLEPRNFMTFHLVGNGKSSQLTNSVHHNFQRDRLKAPTRI
jgi:hypothetical protein